MHRPARVALMATLAATLLLLALAWGLPADALAGFTAEDGPMEMLSAALWVAMGAIALWRARPGSPTVWAYALTGVVLAVRETGIPRAWVPSGARLLKLAYYRDAAVPALERAVTGAIVAVLLVALIGAVVATARYLWQRRGWRQPDGQVLLLAGVVLVVSQLCEHGGSWQMRLGLPPAGEGAKLVLLVLEEGLEAVTAALACAGVWLAAGWPRQARTRAARGRATGPSRADAPAGVRRGLF
jgi:hypothetical protein